MVGNMSKLNDLFKERKKQAFNNFFGENNYVDGGNRFKVINCVINEDEFVICTNNISYWSNKGQFVMWVAKNKIVYIKNFQIMPAYNYENIGNCYFVKVNKNYFKPYNCFENDDLGEYEDTFESLKEEARKQSSSDLWFKLEADKYGNKYCY